MNERIDSVTKQIVGREVSFGSVDIEADSFELLENSDLNIVKIDDFLRNFKVRNGFQIDSFVKSMDGRNILLKKCEIAESMPFTNESIKSIN